MNKSKRFIHWESDTYYAWGFLVIGRVACPVYVYVVLGAALTMLTLMSGGVTYAAGKDAGDGGVMLLGGILSGVALSLFLLVGVFYGIYWLVYWLRNSFEIRGPRS